MSLLPNVLCTVWKLEDDCSTGYSAVELSLQTIHSIPTCKCDTSAHWNPGSAVIMVLLILIRKMLNFHQRKIPDRAFGHHSIRHHLINHPLNDQSPWILVIRKWYFFPGDWPDEDMCHIFCHRLPLTTTLSCVSVSVRATSIASFSKWIAKHPDQ